MTAVAHKNSNETSEPQSTTKREGVGKEETIYTSRFSPEEDALRSKTWQIICKDFLQRFIPVNGSVLDVGAGDGLFIKNIKAGKKFACDLSDHVSLLSEHGIEVLKVPATEITKNTSEKFDIVFMSNFLEHLPTKSILLEVLEECSKALKKHGHIIILQPNIRYVGVAYWDYVDHHIALTEHSLVEALEVCGFKIEKIIPKFLPYTAKCGVGKIAKLDKEGWLVKAYLKFPILWKLFGAQTFIIARRKEQGE